MASASGYRQLVDVLTPFPVELGGQILNRNFQALADFVLDSGVLRSQSGVPTWDAGQLQRVNIVSTAPSYGQVLQYNGSNWAPSGLSTTNTTVKGRVNFIYDMPPLSGFAQPTTLNGGSTPRECFPQYAFDSVSVEYMDWLCYLDSNYSGGGLTFKMALAGSGNVNVGLAIRRLDTVENYNVSHSYDYNIMNVALPDGQYRIVQSGIAFANGADMDSLTASEYFVLRMRRDPAHVSDTSSSDLYLLNIVGTET